MVTETKEAPKAEAAKVDTKQPDTKYKPLSKDDHVGQIAELARGLMTTSPSGAETIGEKILEHVGAIQDPKTYDDRKAAEHKAEQEVEAQRAKDRAANKAFNKGEKPA